MFVFADSLVLTIVALSLHLNRVLPSIDTDSWEGRGTTVVGFGPWKKKDADGEELLLISTNDLFHSLKKDLKLKCAKCIHKPDSSGIEGHK